jgi:hypothetical protein
MFFSRDTHGSGCHEQTVGKLGPSDVAHFGGNVWLSLPPRLKFSGSYHFIPLG